MPIVDKTTVIFKNSIELYLNTVTVYSRIGLTNRIKTFLFISGFRAYLFDIYLIIYLIKNFFMVCNLSLYRINNLFSLKVTFVLFRNISIITTT